MTYFQRKQAHQQSLPSQEDSQDLTDLGKHSTESKQVLISRQLPTTNPDLADLDATIYEAKPISDSSFKIPNLYLPIAIKKEVRTCTQHPISKSVTYDSLSATYKNFLSFLESVTIPINWKHAISKPC